VPATCRTRCTSPTAADPSSPPCTAPCPPARAPRAARPSLLPTDRPRRTRCWAAANQSETESDSDGSCTASSGAAGSLQSILRLPSRADFSCRSSLKKQASVEFALDIDIDIDEDDDIKRRLDGSCAARCMPRRLTIEEKAALYQVRPDLELVPTVLLLSELEEMRRRRQRKLMFSVLGASLILLMMIVFYYLVSQM
jgi:hypothetical protein